MASTMSPNTTSDFGTTWDFQKQILVESQRSPSDVSSTDFAEMQDNIRFKSTITDIKRTVIEAKSPVALNERYMSSEEALSPTEHDSDTGDEEDDHVLEIGIAAPIRFTVCDMAVAICIVSVGKPKLINIPVPSINTSVSRRNDRNFGRASWMPKRRATSDMPTKPVLRQRNPNRPNLEIHHMTSSCSDASTTLLATTTTATTASTSSNNSPALSSSSETPPTSAYTESVENDSTRNSLFHPSPTLSSPKMEFAVDRSSTVHSFLETDPYENTSPPAHRRHSRFRNLSQKMKFPRFGKANTASDDGSTMQDEPFSPRPISMTNSQSQPRRKMVARGAAEREPTIKIPPCPYDLDPSDEMILQESKIRRKSLAY